MNEALSELYRGVFGTASHAALRKDSRRLRARARAAHAAHIVAETLTLEAILYGREGRKREMAQLLRQACLESGTITNYLSLARTLHECGAWSEAVEAYETLSTLPGVNDDVRQVAAQNILACKEARGFQPSSVGSIPVGETMEIQTTIDAAYGLSKIGERASALNILGEALARYPNSKALRVMRNEVFALKPWLRP